MVKVFSIISAAASVAKWLSPLTFSALNLSSSHRCGCEPSSGHMWDRPSQVLLAGGQVFFSGISSFAPPCDWLGSNWGKQYWRAVKPNQKSVHTQKLSGTQSSWGKGISPSLLDFSDPNCPTALSVYDPAEVDTRSVIISLNFYDSWYIVGCIDTVVH